jgi:hypothetical protein
MSSFVAHYYDTLGRESAEPDVVLQKVEVPNGEGWRLVSQSTVRDFVVWTWEREVQS